MRKIKEDAVYIMFDGTSYYGIYGCDVREDIEYNDSEVYTGPFKDWPDDKIDELNEIPAEPRWR